MFYNLPADPLAHSSWRTPTLSGGQVKNLTPPFLSHCPLFQSSWEGTIPLGLKPILWVCSTKKRNLHSFKFHYNRECSALLLQLRWASAQRSNWKEHTQSSLKIYIIPLWSLCCLLIPGISLHLSLGKFPRFLCLWVLWLPISLSAPPGAPLASTMSSALTHYIPQPAQGKDNYYLHFPQERLGNGSTEEFGNLPQVPALRSRGTNGGILPLRPARYHRAGYVKSGANWETLQFTSCAAL